MKHQTFKFIISIIIAAAFLCQAALADELRPMAAKERNINLGKVEPTIHAIQAYLGAIQSEFTDKLKQEMGSIVGWRMCGPASIALAKVLSIKTGLPIGQEIAADHIEVKVDIYDPPGAPQNVEEQTYVLVHLGNQVIYVDAIYGLLMIGDVKDFIVHVCGKEDLGKFLRDKFHIVPFDPAHPHITNSNTFKRWTGHAGAQQLEEIAQFHRASEEIGNKIEGLLPSTGASYVLKNSMTGLLEEYTMTTPLSDQIIRVIHYFISQEEGQAFDKEMLAAINEVLKKISGTVPGDRWLPVWADRDAVMSRKITGVPLIPRAVSAEPIKWMASSYLQRLLESFGYEYRVGFDGGQPLLHDMELLRTGKTADMKIGDPLLFEMIVEVLGPPVKISTVLDIRLKTSLESI